MKIKEQWEKLKEQWKIFSEFMEQSEGYYNKSYIAPVLIPERGFIIFDGQEKPNFFTEEYHCDNVRKEIKKVYPEEFNDIEKKCGNDINQYGYYLMSKNAVMFLNHSFVSLNEYQQSPSLIFQSKGILYIPGSISNLTASQANWLVKFLYDFERMDQLYIELAYIDQKKGKWVYEDISLNYLREQLNDHLYHHMSQAKK